MKWVYICLGIASIANSIQVSAEHKSVSIINNKTSHYFKGAQGDLVTFYARENATSNKKIARKGILIKKPRAKATIVICHGFTCDKYDVSFLHLLFPDYNTFAFDFRAHGEDIEGQQCTLGRDEAYDVLAAVRFIKSMTDLKDKPVIAYGFSMGAAAAIIAQAQDKKLFDALVLDCPFDSTDKLLERGLGQLKINLFGYEMSLPGSSLLKSYAYSPYVQTLLKAILKVFTKMDSTPITTNFCPVYPEEAIKYITIPCFIIACVNDDKAPEEAVRAVYNGAKGFKRLWITDGRRHYDPIFYKLHDYCYKVNRFIKQVLTGSLDTKKADKIIKDVKHTNKIIPTNQQTNPEVV